MEIKAVNDNILIEPVPVKEVEFVPGLVLSAEESKTMMTREATVLSKGPLVSEAIEVGDVVIYQANMANGVHVDGEMLSVLKENCVILIKK